jgi:hypothetical protein
MTADEARAEWWRRSRLPGFESFQPDNEALLEPFVDNTYMGNRTIFLEPEGPWRMAVFRRGELVAFATFVPGQEEEARAWELTWAGVDADRSDETNIWAGKTLDAGVLADAARCYKAVVEVTRRAAN